MERRKKSSKKVIEKISPKSRKGPLHRLKHLKLSEGFVGEEERLRPLWILHLRWQIHFMTMMSLPRYP